MAAADTVCPTCGRVRVKLDGHHALREANAGDVVIDACRGECHPILSERQYEANIAGSDGEPAAGGELAWAVARGSGDLIYLFAYHAPTLGKECAEMGERMIAGLGRLVDMVDRATGGPGIKGPNPHGNDLRRAGRRGRQVRYRLEPREPARTGGDPSTTAKRYAAIFWTIGKAGRYLPDQVFSAELSEKVLRLAGQMGPVLERLFELEARDSSALKELVGRLREENVFLGGRDSRLLGVGKLEDLVPLWPRLRSVGALGELLVQVGLDLADAADAELVLERFLSSLRS